MQGAWPHVGERGVPVLLSRDLMRTIQFYERLGFSLLAPPGDWPYAMLARGAIEVHFNERRDLAPSAPGAAAYLRVDDADHVHGAWAKADIPHEGAPRLTDARDEPWGMREFTLVDEDGNLLRVGSPLPVR